MLYLMRGFKYTGIINVFQSPEKTTYSLELNHEPEELETKKRALFKVQPSVKVDANMQPLE